MGYRMTQTKSCFGIDKSNFPQVLDAIRAIADSPTRISWVVKPSLKKAKTVEKAFYEWRWKLDFDKEGNVCGIMFEGEKAGMEMVLFKAIAPFVVDGSYIQMSGEEGDVWRWIFKDGDAREVYPKMVWD